MTRLLRAAVALLFAFGLSCAAQTMTVSGNQIVNSTGTQLASGVIYFAPVDANENPLSYRMGQHGQTVTTAVSATVTNGSFTLTLPDVSQTDPTNVCFSATVIDNSTGFSVLGPGYKCVQPDSVSSSWCTSTTCNFDTYVPNIAGLPLTTISGNTTTNWSAPGAIGSGTPNTGAFTSLSVSAFSVNSSGTMQASQTYVTTLGYDGNNYFTSLDGYKYIQTCYFGCAIYGVMDGAHPTLPIGNLATDPALYINSPQSGISIVAAGSISSSAYTVSGSASEGQSCPNNNTIVGIDGTHLYVCVGGTVKSASLN
jgi:hypothetical protein